MQHEDSNPSIKPNIILEIRRYLQPPNYHMYTYT